MTQITFPWHVQTLQEVLQRRQRMPHAFLLHGREGIGKVEFARALAQSLLCENPGRDGIACGACPACHWFSQGNHPDFREIVPEAMQAEANDDPVVEGETAKPEKKSTLITIDQIRDVGVFFTLSTHRDGFRILLVHPAEAMNPASANALLKTLEEPNPNTLILLIASQPARLLATVKSRCQKLALGVPAHAEALAWLRNEGVADAEILLAQAGGAPLLARNWNTPEYRAQRKTFLDALANPVQSDWLTLAASLEKSDLSQVLHWLHTWCCDLVFQNSASRIRHHHDYRPALERLSRGISLPDLFRYETLLRSARRSIAHSLNARLLLEHLLISYADALNCKAG
jgi:DNA polymerase-3 subunit delta'